MNDPPIKPFASWQPKPGRTACVVPCCRRTAKSVGVGHEVICAKHYRACDKALRAKYRKMNKDIDAALAGNINGQKTLEIQAMIDQSYQIWGELKRQAIEAAVGIG